MERRLFLKGLTGLFVAPAIVKAESLMKIVVPKQEIITDLRTIPNALFFGDMTWNPEMCQVLPLSKAKLDLLTKEFHSSVERDLLRRVRTGVWMPPKGDSNSGLIFTSRN